MDAANGVSSFWRIYGVIQDLGGPLAAICTATGFMLIIAGNRRGGLDRIKWAALGYVGLQWTPWLMQIIKQVGATPASMP